MYRRPPKNAENEAWTSKVLRKTSENTRSTKAWLFSALAQQIVKGKAQSHSTKVQDTTYNFFCWQKLYEDSLELRIYDNLGKSSGKSSKL